MKKTALVVCPGRGSYNKAELGYISNNTTDTGLLAQFDRVLPDGDRVHIDEAIDRLDPLILLLREAFERAEIVAQRQSARGLDP